MRQHIVQKENEKQMMADNERQAELAREALFADNKDLLKKAGKGNMDVADMGLTFDCNGKVMKQTKVNGDKLADVST